MTVERAAESHLWHGLLDLEERYRRLDESNEAKSRILDLLGRVTAESSVDDMCRAIVAGVREALCIDRVGLFLWEPAGDCFRGTFGTAIDGQTTDERLFTIDLWPGGPWEAVVKGADLVRGCSLGVPAALPGEGTVTADLVALRHGKRLYGVISVDNRISQRSIPEETLEHLRLLSPVLGNTVELSRVRTALERSEDRFMRIAENNREWIWELDAQERYTYCSPVVTRILGYDVGELQGKHFLDLVAASERERVAEALSDVRAKRTLRDGLTHHQVHRDGRLVHVQTITIPVLGADGAVTGFWGAHRDVTRELELEAELRHSQKMEAIGRLAGGIAHDFNNALTTILGGCNLLLEGLVEGDPVCEDIREIQQAGERAAGLTQQLLAFSRRQFLTRKPVDLKAILSEMEDLLRRTLGEAIELNIRSSGDLPLVEADADQLRQVLLQLAVHAREAMVDPPPLYQPELWPSAGESPAGRSRAKRLTIETSAVTLDEHHRSPRPNLFPGVYVLLTVADTGAGMTADVQQHIFEPYFTTQAMGQGSGLGLSTVYGMVRQLGGDIHVSSAPGAGTTFCIYLPQAETDETRTSPLTTSSTDAHGTEHILIVEDDERVRELMRRMLTSYGYKVSVAADGADALALAREVEPAIDLVVADMIMPGMTGAQLVQALRAARPGLKALHISGYGVEPGAEMQAAFFLKKPFSRDELAGRIRQILDAS